MITREELQGQWTQLKGQIRERWGEISDDELQQAQGNTEQLMGLLEKKTGESRRQLEQFVQGAVKTDRTSWAMQDKQFVNMPRQPPMPLARDWDRLKAGLNRGCRKLTKWLHRVHSSRLRQPLVWDYWQESSSRCCCDLTEPDNKSSCTYS